MPKILQAFDGSLYNHSSELFSGELFFVKSCEGCGYLIAGRESETYVTINPKKQKTECMKCPNCGHSIKIRSIK